MLESVIVTLEEWINRRKCAVTGGCKTHGRNACLAFSVLKLERAVRANNEDLTEIALAREVMAEEDIGLHAAREC